MKLNSFKQKIITLAVGCMVASIATPAFAANYQVKANDTLWKIAQSTKIPLQSILKANSNVDPMNLQAGQMIHLGDAYVVSGEETFWTISQKLNIPLNALLQANPNVDPMNVYPGIRLILPAAISSALSTQSLSYSKVVSAVASAYSGAPEENGGFGGLDYFGNQLKVGTIAVDPKVIPLGSTVYITGYSFPGLPGNGMIAHATDMGSAIQGNRVDIYVPGSSESVNNFGFQNVKIYVLK